MDDPVPRDWNAETSNLPDASGEPQASTRAVFVSINRDAIGRDYDSAGRVDGALLEKLVPKLDCDFYLCGPTGFMASVQEHLENRGVPLERIRSEAF